jgi:hypothetical protein
MSSDSNIDVLCALDDACSRFKSTIHQFTVYCAKENYDEKVVELTGEWKEIFPNVQGKVMFPKKDTGNKQIMIKANAGAKVDLHKMIPHRFVYVIYGEQRQLETGMILFEDMSMEIRSLQKTELFFPVDTKIIMEVERKD